MIHMMGVGGAGMSPLAELMLIKGHQVSGCDRDRNYRVDRLVSLGLKFFKGHDPGHLLSVERLIYSRAISPTEKELVKAEEKSIIIQSRGEAMQQELAGYKIVGIAGTHGKTTTTAMIAYIVQSLNIPAVTFVGAELSLQGSGLSWAESELAILELDESDRMFLLFNPFWGVVTSIEVDHLGMFYKNEDQLYEAFKQYLTNSQKKLLMVTDKMTAKLAQELKSDVITCGQSKAEDIIFTPGIDHMVYRGQRVELPVTGIHNYKNAALALAVSELIGIPLSESLSCLQKFPGVSRRNEIFWQTSHLTMISDYAHHPTEVSSVITTAKKNYDQVTVIFQPHLYSRTKLFASEFAEALSIADQVLLMPIYPAREEPIAGVTSELIGEHLEKLRQSYLLLSGEPSLIQWLRNNINSLQGGLILIGAGDIDQWRENLIQIVRERTG